MTRALHPSQIEKVTPRGQTTNKRQTDTHTDNVTYRLSRPGGRFSENTFKTTIKDGIAPFSTDHHGAISTPLPTPHCSLI